MAGGIISVAPEQLGRWFDAYAARLVLYARQFVEAGLAEDLVQDLFVRLAGQKREPEKVKAWLLTSVRHAALDVIKTGRRRAARDAAAGMELQRAALDRRASDPLNAAEVEASLATLPAEQREIITLKIWGEATFAEIAALMGVPMSKVYAEYRSGLQMLRSRLESPCPKS